MESPTRTRTRNKSIAEQRRDSLDEEIPEKKKYDGDESRVISTGSTLLDLAISGGRISGGGIPGGILMEVFGPSGSGKTVLLCEIAGNVRRQGGENKYQDPEARLNKQFARIFDEGIQDSEIDNPDTPVEVFTAIRDWKPKSLDVINGIFVDSTASLASDLEMEDKKDEYSRRAKLFSQECRKTCRTITANKYLTCFSNQIRQKIDAMAFGEKFSVPGGEAIPFYASLRLRIKGIQKIKKKLSINGIEHERVIGVQNEIEIYKSSVWKPYRSANLTIIFDYGIDDVRENLQYAKKHKKTTTYTVNGESVGQSIDKAIQAVEEGRLEKRLRREVIELWNEIEQKFETERQPKRRFQ